ncbi:MAG: serine/threonine-protein kinase [Planctomycetota bacterium]
MTGDRDEALGRLTEELAVAIAAGDSIVLAAWAQRFAVTEADVQACLRALRLLDDGLGEEPDEGPPELPKPTLPADYELLGELGRGGMGVVYRARQRSLGREVAVKVLRPGDLVFGDALRRFRSEAQSLARLRHRHIVSVHDLGENPDGTLWFAMDLIDGTTLADEAAKRRRNTPAQVVRILRQVASAIAHAHAHGIVHRDLKPQNVLLDRDGNAFVCDFGLARDAAAAGARTLTGELLGTPAYMSPEQARGDAARIGEATDVWALGALLYELLTGRGPFRGMPLHETIRAILEDDPPRPRSLDGNVPAELEAVCLKALHKRPEQRYPTALAFAEDLERFADGRGVLARSPGRVVRGMRWLRRRAKPALAVVAAVLVTVFAVLLWLPSLRRDAVVDEVARLVQAGHAAAAIESLRTLLADVAPDAAERDRLEWLLARAHNDVAAAALCRGDDPSADAEAARALAEERQHSGGVLFTTETERYAAWMWELIRARAMLAPPMSQLPIAGNVLAPLVHAGLRDPATPRAAGNAWAAARSGVPIAGLDDETRLQLLEPLVRAAGRALADGWHDVAQRFPCTWRGADVDAWWSPAIEQRLADLATDVRRPAPARAVAFRAFCQLVALPVAQLAREGTDFDAVIRGASEVIGAWRAWQQQPLENQLRARVDLLIDAKRRPGERMPGCSAEIDEMLRDSVGRPVDDGFADWWSQQRQRPFADVLRDGLGLATDPPIDLVEALDRSAAAHRPEAMAWRQLAWLQLRDAASVPRSTPRTTDGGVAWRNAVLAAAGRDDPRRFVVRIGLLRFADGEAVPQLLDSTAVSMRLGEPISLQAQASCLSLRTFTHRKAFEDESARQPGRLVRWDLEPLPGAPPLGTCTARVEARLVLDSNGVQLRGTGQLRATVPQMSYSTHHDDVADRVRLGTAACFDSMLLGWYDGERHATLQLLVALDETADEQRDTRTFGTEQWRRAAMQRFVAEADAPDPLGGPIDWALPGWWPMPEAADALQRLARRGQPDRLSKAALQLAGLPQGPGQWPPGHYRVPLALLATHVVAAADDAAVRREVLDDLAELGPAAFPEQVAATLRAAAARRGEALPEKLEQTLEQAPGSWLWRLRHSPVLISLLAFAATAFVLLRLASREHRREAQVATGVILLLFGLEWRVQIGDLVLTPSFLLIAASTALAATAHRVWSWYRRAAFVAMLGLVVWTALAWWGVLMPPYGWNGALVILTFLTGATWLDSPPRRRAQLRRSKRTTSAAGA